MPKKYGDIDYKDPDAEAKRHAIVTMDMPLGWWMAVAFVGVCVLGLLIKLLTSSSALFIAVLGVVGIFVGLGMAAREIYKLYIYRKYPDLQD
jgi:hypothetical protein